MTQQQILLVLGGLALIGVLSALRGAGRAKNKAVKGVSDAARMTGTAFRAVFTTAVIVGVQWLVATKFASNTTVLLVVLALPAVFAGAQIARLLAVREVVYTTRKGGHR